MTSPDRTAQPPSSRNVTTAPRPPGQSTPPGSTPTSRPPMPPRRTLTWFLLILVLNFIIARLLFPPSDEPTTVPYTLLRDQVTKHNVAAIYSRGERITGHFRAPVTYPTTDSTSKTPPKKVGSFATTPPSFAAPLPSFVGPDFETLLIANGVEISAEPIDQGNSPLTTLLFGFGPALLLILFYVWLFRRAAKQGGGMGMGGILGIGRSQAKRFDITKQDRVTFDDVAGIDEAENELVEVFDFLKDPQK